MFCDFLPEGCFPAPRAVLKPRPTSTCSNPFRHHATDLNSVTVFEWQFIFWDHVIYVTVFVYISSYHKSQISLSKSLLTHVCAACHYFFLMLFKRSDANYSKIYYWVFHKSDWKFVHKSDRSFSQIWSEVFPRSLNWSGQPAAAAAPCPVPFFSLSINQIFSNIFGISYLFFWFIALTRSSVSANHVFGIFP